MGFADDSFQVLLTHEIEESRCIALQVIHVQQVRVVAWNEPAEHPLAFQKRLRSEITAIQPEEIERITNNFLTQAQNAAEIEALGKEPVDSADKLHLACGLSNRWLYAEPDGVKRGKENERKYSSNRGPSDKGVG